MQLKKVILVLLASTTYWVGGAPNLKTETDVSCVQNVEAARAGNALKTCTLSRKYPDLTSMFFDARSVPADDSTCLTLKMFIEMGFVQQFNIPTDVLYRFIKQVQAGYRDVPYHSWSHGFSLLQFVFGVFKNNQLLEKKHLTPLEGLALMTAAMCHDIDHPGTNNQFQIDIKSPMANQYGSLGSILERHHIAKTLTLLNSADNFLVHLDKEQFELFQEYTKQCILATDLALHLKQVVEEQSMASGGYNPLNDTHRAHLRANIMSCGDFNDQIKAWPIQKSSVVKLYSEFFAQGDEQKKMGIIPQPMMDRDKANIPLINQEFIRNVVIPDFRVLTTLYPESQVLIDRLQQNIVNWGKCKPYFEEKVREGRPRLSILLDRQFDLI